MSAITTLPPKAVIFDAYGTLFDVHSVIAAAEQMFPGHGDALSQLWRQKQIEYTQLRTLADPADAPGAHYRPFWDITLDALRFAAKKLQLTLGRAAEKRLMDEYACLSAFPDAVPALRSLRDAAASPSIPTTPAGSEPLARPGLAILSNGNPQMLDIAVKSAGMTGLFDHVLSVDAVRAYKPSPAAYALGTQAFDAPAARDRLRVVERLGRGGRDVVRLHHVLAQPAKRTRRRTRRHAAWRGQRHERSARISADPHTAWPHRQ